MSIIPDHDEPQMRTARVSAGPQCRWTQRRYEPRSNAAYVHAAPEGQAAMQFALADPELLEQFTKICFWLSRVRAHPIELYDDDFAIKQSRAIFRRRAFFKDFAPAVFAKFMQSDHPLAKSPVCLKKPGTVTKAIKHYAVREWLAREFGDPDYVPA